jgi:hypothetical protein
VAGNNALLISVLRDTDSDEFDLDDSARQLMTGLMDIDDVSSVAAVNESDVPKGSKSGSADIVGWLAVELGDLGLRALVRKIKEFARLRRCSIEITIDGDVLRVTGVSSEQRDRIIEAWLARHAP